MSEWIALHRELVNGVGIDALAALSVWIVMASGRVPLGNMSFAALGGFTAILCMVRYGMPPVFAVAAGAVAPALAGGAIGSIVARLPRAQFAIATLALAAPVLFLVALQKLPRAPIHLTHAAATSPIYVAVITCTVLLWFVMRSRHGVALRSVAQDERAAATLGINAMGLRMVAMSAGAAVAGFAGSLLVLQNGAVGVTTFGYEQSVGAIAAAIVGGAETAAGPLVGAAALAAAGQAAPWFALHRAVGDAILLLAFSIAMPGGIASLVPALLRLRTRRPAVATP